MKSRPDSEKAISSGRIYVAGPSQLVVPVIGFVGRYPVFIPDVPYNETFNFPAPYNRERPAGGVPSRRDATCARGDGRHCAHRPLH